VQRLLQFDDKRVIGLPNRRKEITLDVHVNPVERVPVDVIHDIPHEGRPVFRRQNGFPERRVRPAATGQRHENLEARRVPFVDDRSDVEAPVEYEFAVLVRVGKCQVQVGEPVQLQQVYAAEIASPQVPDHLERGALFVRILTISCA
jgi:hypothetical protein